jgi:hypothetical protein
MVGTALTRPGHVGPHLVDDTIRSAAFGVWGPLLEGTPALVREEYYWEAG